MTNSLSLSIYFCRHIHINLFLKEYYILVITSNYPNESLIPVAHRLSKDKTARVFCFFHCWFFPHSFTTKCNASESETKVRNHTKKQEVIPVTVTCKGSGRKVIVAVPINLSIFIPFHWKLVPLELYFHKSPSCISDISKENLSVTNSSFQLQLSHTLHKHLKIHFF